MTSFWSMWVIVLTTVTFVLMSWILFGNRKRREPETDRTTGHVYDGIEEYDNPLPAWWFYMFVITIVWGAFYLVMYPGMGNFPGLLNWTQEKQPRNPCRRRGRKVPCHARPLPRDAGRGNRQ